MNDEINNFINEYRKSLDDQYAADLRNAQNERRTQQRNIMSSANRLGTMYSNFPERMRMQYDTGTYLPTVAKTHQTYQTGLQKLRDNIVGQINNLANINEEIAILNESNQEDGNGKKIAIGGKEYDDDEFTAALKQAGLISPYANKAGATQFSNLKDDDLEDGGNIRYGTWAKKLGAKSTDDFIAGTQFLSEDEQSRFNNAWAKAQKQGYTGIGLNTGKNYQYYGYDDDGWLSGDDTSLINSLGLRFTK